MIVRSSVCSLSVFGIHCALKMSPQGIHILMPHHVAKTPDVLHGGALCYPDGAPLYTFYQSASFLSIDNACIKTQNNI